MSGLLEKSAGIFLLGFFLHALLFSRVGAGWFLVSAMFSLALTLRMHPGFRRVRSWPLAAVVFVLGVLSSLSNTTASMPIEGVLAGPFSARIERNRPGFQADERELGLRGLKAGQVEFGREARFDLPAGEMQPGRGRELLLDGLLTADAEKRWRFRGQVKEVTGFAAWGHQASGMRQILKRRLEEHTTPTLEPWLAALVLGHDLESTESRELLRAAGAGHFFAVSGLHLALVASLVWALLAGLGASRLRGRLLSLPFLFGYALLTGGRPPVMRALSLAVMLCLAEFCGRPLRPLRLLALLLALALAWKPDLVSDISFAFSFAAVAGIVAMTAADPGKDDVLRRFLERKRRRGWRRLLRSTWLVSEAAFLATAPLQIFYFQSFSPAALLSSFLFLPVVSLLLVLGMIGLFFPLPSWPGNLLAEVLVFGLESVAALPGALVETGPISALMLPWPWLMLALAAWSRRRGRAALVVRLVAWSGLPLLLVLSAFHRPELSFEIDHVSGVVRVEKAGTRELLHLGPGGESLSLVRPRTGKSGFERAQTGRRVQALRWEDESTSFLVAGVDPLRLMALDWRPVDLVIFATPVTTTEALLIVERFRPRSYLGLQSLDPEVLRLLTAEGHEAQPTRDEIVVRHRRR